MGEAPPDESMGEAPSVPEPAAPGTSQSTSNPAKDMRGVEIGE